MAKQYLAQGAGVPRKHSGAISRRLGFSAKTPEEFRGTFLRPAPHLQNRAPDQGSFGLTLRLLKNLVGKGAMVGRRVIND